MLRAVANILVLGASEELTEGFVKLFQRRPDELSLYDSNGLKAKFNLPSDDPEVPLWINMFGLTKDQLVYVKNREEFIKGFRNIAKFRAGDDDDSFSGIVCLVDKNSSKEMLKAFDSIMGKWNVPEFRKRSNNNKIPALLVKFDDSITSTREEMNYHNIYFESTLTLAKIEDVDNDFMEKIRKALKAFIDSPSKKKEGGCRCSCLG